ncbi:MAG TPA: type II secretory pathway protein [Desulfobulbaceae bacterium]|nr:type II secretory pathway protein [Desulfobulbaceae bacterium]
MYLSFYGLKHKPFQISTDPRFLWLGEKHEEALATLRYGVLDNKGFLLLTGDVGTGKTTLINALLKTLGPDTLVATVRDPDLEPMDFYNYTAHAFGMQGNYTSKGAFLIAFERFLRDANTSNKTVLLIIDEAQRINQNLLEEVRLLSNIEKEDRKLLNIFFIGQIEFNEILLRPENRPIRQRITVNYNIQPLTKQETDEYIRHRLRIAGTEEKIFAEEALNKIYSFSHGYPRLINIICDRSLLTGFVAEEKIISAAHVQECIHELTIPRSIPLQLAPQTSVPDNSETAEVHSSEDRRSTSLLPAKTRRKTAPSWKHLLTASFLGLLLAAAFLSFVLPGDIRQHFLHLFDMSSLTPENKTARQTEAPPPADLARPNTRPGENPKPAGSLPGQNNPAPDDPERKVLNTAPAGNNAESSGTATHSATLQDYPNLIDTSFNSDPKGAASGELNEIAVAPSNKIILPFSSDSNFMTADVVDNLDNLVQFLLKNPEYRVIVTGYTDSQGNEHYNKKLSEFRAYTVKSYLAGKGLPESRITAQGFGAQSPIASNETASGRIANRRVEIELQK